MNGRTRCAVVPEDVQKGGGFERRHTSFQLLPDPKRWHRTIVHATERGVSLWVGCPVDLRQDVEESLMPFTHPGHHPSSSNGVCREQHRPSMCVGRASVSSPMHGPKGQYLCVFVMLMVHRGHSHVTGKGVL